MGAVRRVEAVVVDARAELGELVVRYAPRSGPILELVDRMPLRPPGDLRFVRSIGRLLRLLRAGRVQVPPNPYGLGAEPERALDLARRCRGAHMILHITERIERDLVLWTEAGNDRISDVLDVREEPDALVVIRSGARNPLRVPRASLIRFETQSRSFPVIVDVEPATRSRLR